jgi:hypothetical protein
MANNLVSVDDLRKLALKQAGELIDGSSDFDSLSDEGNGVKELEYINNLYKFLHYGGSEISVESSDPFDWLKANSPELITVIPDYETGTISLTNNSTAGTLSTAPTGFGSFLGYYLKIQGRETFYKISAHTADATSVTLDQVYLEATGATLTFKLIKLDYTLTNSMARIYKELRVHKRQFNEDSKGSIYYITEDSLDSEYPLHRLVSGTPTRFTILKNVDDIHTLKFDRYPQDDKMRVEVPYIPTPEELIVDTFLDADVNTTNERINLPEHGFQTNQIVRLTSSGTLPAGLNLDTTYYVIRFDKDYINLSTTRDGTAVNITAAASGGTHNIASIPRMPLGYRGVLANYATYYMLADKSDQRADLYLRLAQAQLKSMVDATRRDQRRKSKNRGRLISRMDDGYPSKSMGPRIFDDLA